MTLVTGHAFGSLSGRPRPPGLFNEDKECFVRAALCVWVRCVSYPRHSMYAIYADIDLQNHPNVGIYGIHGVSGYGFHEVFHGHVSSRCFTVFSNHSRWKVHTEKESPSWCPTSQAPNTASARAFFWRATNAARLLGRLDATPEDAAPGAVERTWERSRSPIPRAARAGEADRIGQETRLLRHE